MKTMYDVQQLLKGFGIFVYTGNRLSDLELMALELKELFDYDLIMQDDYLMARLILQKEMQLMKKNEY